MKIKVLMSNGAFRCLTSLTVAPLADSDLFVIYETLERGIGDDPPVSSAKRVKWKRILSCTWQASLAGVHPLEISDPTPDFSALSQLTNQRQVFLRALGRCAL